MLKVVLNRIASVYERKPSSPVQIKQNNPSKSFSSNNAFAWVFSSSVILTTFSVSSSISTCQNMRYPYVYTNKSPFRVES